MLVSTEAWFRYLRLLKKFKNRLLSFDVEVECYIDDDYKGKAILTKSTTSLCPLSDFKMEVNNQKRKCRWLFFFALLGSQFKYTGLRISVFQRQYKLYERGINCWDSEGIANWKDWRNSKLKQGKWEGRKASPSQLASADIIMTNWQLAKQYDGTPKLLP